MFGRFALVVVAIALVCIPARSENWLAKLYENAPELKVESIKVSLEDGKHDMHILKGGDNGSGRPTFLLIHGASKLHQKAEYWNPHFDFFARLGRFYAVDLFGHGESSPRGSREDDTAALKKLLEQEGVTENVVLIGRSAGGAIMSSLLQDEGFASKVSKIVAIAPYGLTIEKIPEYSRKKELLLFWAEKDPIHNYSDVQYVIKAFDRVRRFIYPNLKSHMPEIDDSQTFQTEIARFVLSKERSRRTKSSAMSS